MDLDKDDELDYEENDPESDSENVLRNKTSEETLPNDPSNLSSTNDQYLQITCTEEEEFLSRLNEKPPSTIAEPKSSDEEKKRAVKERRKTIEENNEKECDSPKKSTKNIIRINNNSEKYEKSKDFRPVRNNFEQSTPLRKTPAVNPWLFKNGTPFSQNFEVPFTTLFNNQVSPLSQNLQPNPAFPFSLSSFNSSSNLPPLMSINTGLMSLCNSNLSHISVNNFNQNRNKYWQSSISHPYLKKNAKTGFGLSKVLGFRTTESDLLKTNSTGKYCTLSSGGCMENYQTATLKMNFKQSMLQNQIHSNSNTGKPNFSIANLRIFESENPFRNIQCSSLKEDEKELNKLKKEARLKRFMHNDIVRFENKQNDAGIDRILPSDINSNTDYFEKTKKQKQTGEKLFSSKDIPSINMESLLKKVNPFDTVSQVSNGSLNSKIKIENECLKNIKKEKDPEETLHAATQNYIQNVNPDLSNVALKSISPPLIKNEKEFPVKFVRTVSKSYEELGVKKPKEELVLEEKNATFAGNSKNTFPLQDSHWFGCIVKVLNISPFTTINDILLLCNPVGMVMEVKLNSPKENSAVIRFAEPASAENFYNLYHKKKVNNYLISVIVV